MSPVISTGPSKEDEAFAFTLNIGTPDISETENKSPDKSSVIENNCPCEPCMSNTVEPDAYMFTVPDSPFSTIRGVSFSSIPSPTIKFRP